MWEEREEKRTMNNLYFILLSIFLLLYIIIGVKKRKLSIKASFWWILGAIIILILSIFPYSIDWFAKQLNIDYPPSLLFLICIMFLVFIIFRLTKQISELELKVIELGQELAVLKDKVHNDNKKTEKIK